MAGTLKLYSGILESQEMGFEKDVCVGNVRVSVPCNVLVFTRLELPGDEGVWGSWESLTSTLHGELQKLHTLTLDMLNPLHLNGKTHVTNTSNCWQVPEGAVLVHTKPLRVVRVLVVFGQTFQRSHLPAWDEMSDWRMRLWVWFKVWHPEPHMWSCSVVKHAIFGVLNESPC